MKTSEGTIRPAEQAGGAYWLGPGEGDARRVLDELDTFKATSGQTAAISRTSSGWPLPRPVTA
jgi:hypothetical protein